MKILFPSYQYLHVHVHTYMRVRGFVQLYWSLCNLYYTACSLCSSVCTSYGLHTVCTSVAVFAVCSHSYESNLALNILSIHRPTVISVGPGSRARARVRVILICLIRTV